MISLNKLIKISNVVATLCATLSFHSSYAQAADQSVNFQAQISANTCLLSISDTRNTTKSYTGIRVVSFGTDTSTATSAGTIFGSLITVTLAVVDPTNTATSCTITGGTNNKWTVYFDLPAGTVDSTITNKPYLKNTAASGAATGVGFVLIDSATSSPYATLLEGQGVNSTRVSATPVANTSTMTFGAKLMTTTASKPTAGVVSAVLPLTIIYN